MVKLTLKLLMLFCAAAVLTSARAEFPERPIRILVPFVPGGGTDILARMIGQKLTQAWGKQVVIDNRAGANGIVAAELTAKANPDGHTLMFVAIGHAINPLLQKKLPYDPEKAFQPISLTAILPLLMVVHPSVKVTSVQDVIALAKAAPKPLSYASGGVGSSQHLATALFSHMAGLKMNHVPYKGGNQGLIEVIAGHLDIMITTILTVVPHVKAGRLRALAVTTAKRNTAVPDLPTISEAALRGYESVAWYGVVAPAGLPPKVLSVLSAEIIKGTHAPDMSDTLIKQGAEPVGNTPREFAAFIKAESAKYANVIKATGVISE